MKKVQLVVGMPTDFMERSSTRRTSIDIQRVICRQATSNDLQDDSLEQVNATAKANFLLVFFTSREHQVTTLA